MKTKKTTVGIINNDVLSFTAGKDVELDQLLVEADCICSAAHVHMLSKIGCKPPIINQREYRYIIKSLNDKVT